MFSSFPYTYGTLLLQSLDFLDGFGVLGVGGFDLGVGGGELPVLVYLGCVAIA